MSDSINPSTVQLIDIEYLLDESETDARQKLLDARFEPRVIDTCVTGQPYGRYMGYVQDEHPLLFNYEYRYDVALLQHIQNLRVWLANKEIPADEWLSHGYALAWMHHHSAGPDRYNKTISLFQTEKAIGSRRSSLRIAAVTWLRYLLITAYKKRRQGSLTLAGISPINHDETLV